LQHLQSNRRSSNKLFLNRPTRFYLNKVSPLRGVILLDRRRVLLPGELRCICKCYRRRQTPATVTSLAPYTLCRPASNNGINRHQLTSQSTTSCLTRWRLYRDVTSVYLSWIGQLGNGSPAAAKRETRPHALYCHERQQHDSIRHCGTTVNVCIVTFIAFY